MTNLLKQPTPTTTLVPDVSNDSGIPLSRKFLSDRLAAMMWITGATLMTIILLKDLVVALLVR